MVCVALCAACDKKRPQAMAPRLGPPVNAATAARVAEPQAPEPSAPTTQGVAHAGGLTWEADGAHFLRQQPAHAMRNAQYGLVTQPEVALAIYHFGKDTGGSTEANLTRWLEQFTQPDGATNRSRAKLATVERDGLVITTVDLTGNFAGMQGAGSAAAGAAQSGQRLLGAIAEGPEGPVFFKLVGPEARLAGVKDAFAALIASIRPLRPNEAAADAPKLPAPSSQALPPGHPPIGATPPVSPH